MFPMYKLLLRFYSHCVVITLYISACFPNLILRTLRSGTSSYSSHHKYINKYQDGSKTSFKVLFCLENTRVKWARYLVIRCCFRQDYLSMFCFGSTCLFCLRENFHNFATFALFISSSPFSFTSLLSILKHILNIMPYLSLLL